MRKFECYTSPVNKILQYTKPCHLLYVVAESMWLLRLREWKVFFVGSAGLNVTDFSVTIYKHLLEKSWGITLRFGKFVTILGPIINSNGAAYRQTVTSLWWESGNFSCEDCVSRRKFLFNQFAINNYMQFNIVNNLSD